MVGGGETSGPNPVKNDMLNRLKQWLFQAASSSPSSPSWKDPRPFFRVDCAQLLCLFIFPKLSTSFE
ncbi:hypothetical protein M407DRAFT_23110 [Tulasnella calospora MUT 4182]|uniref:Uncharacterized protein n=1 Tax=Tulasnella calospora MUT 4182 TaxID=1051891 RepID=A0A0C3QK63_9AGAM|nr:hypothetical protein M407DRAFT_23110 [Tulasnella calospora MUT 4182]